MREACPGNKKKKGEERKEMRWNLSERRRGWLEAGRWSIKRPGWAGGGKPAVIFVLFFYREICCEKVNASLCFVAAGKHVSGPPLQLPAGVGLNSRWCLQVGEAARDRSGFGE